LHLTRIAENLAGGCDTFFKSLPHQVVRLRAGSRAEAADVLGREIASKGLPAGVFALEPDTLLGSLRALNAGEGGKDVPALGYGTPINVQFVTPDRLVATGDYSVLGSVPVAEPGDYVFFLEPTPYWEPAERKMIVHYTKVVVDVLGAEQGWDAMVGFPVEIEPLVRPFGLWTGNTFRGIVGRDGAFGRPERGRSVRASGR
jgi:hypothetical protein